MKDSTPPRENRTYWRSLERLYDSPAMAGCRGDEFPAGASEAPDRPNRRTMLRLMGASLALAGLASCRRPEERILPYALAPEDVIPGIPRYYATSMPLGTSTYGLLVENHEGRPTKIEGNELHPSSRGSAGAWMQAAVLGLYDPDRSRRPLRRSSPGDPHHAANHEDFAGFWADQARRFEDSRGAGLAVLGEAFASPSLFRLAGRLQERFPEARWVSYDPFGDENLFEGMRRATGLNLRPVYRFERARTILALDADFLLTESEAVAGARGFAEGRRMTGTSDAMNRLYVVESTLTLTGANADHRIALPGRLISRFLLALAAELGRRGRAVPLAGSLGPDELPEKIRGKIGLIAEDLAASPGEALILAGSRQPPEVHALVTALNGVLGGLGNTCLPYEITDTRWGTAADLRSLTEEMREGRISSLIVLGGNPVYNAPADLEFSEALREVEHTVHAGLYVDETARAAEWHLPLSHFLEAWGDVRAADGAAGVVQPLIAPLFDSRSNLEVLGLLVADEEVRGYDLVRETWRRDLLAGEDFEPAWRRVLHDGILEGSAGEPQTPEIRYEATAAYPGPADASRAGDGLELTFHISPSVHDGRFANNGWLQELPDPITKITWDNAALISPATAETLGLKSGEIVRLELGGRAVEAPVWLLPGQADGSIAVSAGYGRTDSGLVGRDVGANAYLLRDSRAPFIDGGLRLEKTGRLHRLAQTQEHWSMEGRALVREATLEEYRNDPDFASAADASLKPAPLWEPPYPFDEGYQWGMTIDLNACIGCNACVAACQAENNIPIVGVDQVRRGREMHWLRVDRYFAGEPADPQVMFQPVPCMHCENAPCEQVCPVAATVHDREGINAMIYNRCIGTRYCSNNCPYKVRRFNFYNYTRDLPELTRMAMNPDVTVRSRGVMEKCTYCIQRINESKIRAKRENRSVRDGEIRTACQQTCPADAIVFGNINDPESRVSSLKKQNRDYILLAELYNRPRTSYLAKLRNPNPGWGEA